MENPPLFKKLVYASSVEQEALNMIILKKKIEEQEKDIRELIMFRFGKETLMEMFELRKQIARDREKAKLKQQRFRRGVTDGIFILGGLLAGIGVILWAVNLITSHGANWRARTRGQPTGKEPVLVHAGWISCLGQGGTSSSSREQGRASRVPNTGLHRQRHPRQANNI